MCLCVCVYICVSVWVCVCKCACERVCVNVLLAWENVKMLENSKTGTHLLFSYLCCFKEAALKAGTLHGLMALSKITNNILKVRLKPAPPPPREDFPNPPQPNCRAKKHSGITQPFFVPAVQLNSLRGGQKASATRSGHPMKTLN